MRKKKHTTTRSTQSPLSKSLSRGLFSISDVSSNADEVIGPEQELAEITSSPLLSFVPNVQSRVPSELLVETQQPKVTIGEICPSSTPTADQP